MAGLLDSKDDRKALWECKLEKTERGGPVAALEQCILSGEMATPELIYTYLRHELQHSDEVLSSMAPQLWAIVNAAPGATLRAHYQDEGMEWVSRRLDIDEMGEWFYQPE